MTRDELANHLDTLFASDTWHWFTWHFRAGGRAGVHPFAADVIDALMAIDAKSPGFARRIAGDLSSLRGMKKHEPHYEQLLQRLAELHIILQLVTHEWSFSASFDLEPTVGDGQLRNPEMRITGGPHPLLVEVKAPSLLQHIRMRGANPAQISTRAVPKEQTAKLAEELGAVTLPRDNVVKDFLVSAESKFRPFRLADPQVRTMLVIVWDDFIYEPLSALLGEGRVYSRRKASFGRRRASFRCFPPSMECWSSAIYTSSCTQREKSLLATAARAPSTTALKGRFRSRHLFRTRQQCLCRRSSCQRCMDCRRGRNWARSTFRPI